VVKIEVKFLSDVRSSVPSSYPCPHLWGQMTEYILRFLKKKSSAPKFLLGGIRFGKNFVGKETLQTSSYTLVECTFKVLPIFWLIGGTAHVMPSSLQLKNVEGTDCATEQRRESLE